MYSGGGGGGSFAVSGALGTRFGEGGNPMSLDGFLVIERPCSAGRTLNALGVCVELNACLVVPCAGNATCTDHPAPAPADASGRTCQCTAGYSGPNCTQINACDSSPCAGANVQCVDLPPPAMDGPNGRQCTCSSGYAINGTGFCADIDGTS